MHWPAEAFYLWWSTQPEVMAADEAARPGMAAEEGRIAPNVSKKS